MLNRLWAALIIIAIGTGFGRSLFLGDDSVNLMAKALFEGAKTGVDLSLGLVSALVLWLGLFQIAEAAGIVQKLARLLAPVLCRLMPDVPKDHPALASVGMNVAMSMLGLDDGALPSGLKAMEELETLNLQPGVATRAQQMFLVYMSTSVTIFPVSILGYRMAAGAVHPADVFLPLLLASYVGLFVGLAYMALAQRLHFFDPVLLIGSTLFVSMLGGIAWFVGSIPSAQISPAVALLGNAALLASVLFFVSFAWTRKVPLYDCFLKGGAKGFSMAVMLIPYVVGMLVAVSLLRASGTFDLLQQALEWACSRVGIEGRWVSALPQGIMKLFSGGGARALMLDSFKSAGPDSFAGHLSSIIQGSTDTTFYILAACAGVAKLNNLGQAVVGAVIASVASFVVAVICALVFFG